MKNTLIILFMVFITLTSTQTFAGGNIFKLPVSILKAVGNNFKPVKFETYQGKKISISSLKGSVKNLNVAQVLELPQLETEDSEIIYPEEIKFAFVKFKSSSVNHLRKHSKSTSIFGRFPMDRK